MKTDLTGEGKLAAKINNRNYLLSGKSNFIALPPYAQYKLEILNDKNSEDSFDIVSGRKQELTLYPGNVGVINPEVKSMVTVFGVFVIPMGSWLQTPIFIITSVKRVRMKRGVCYRYR